ncbi:FtsX-like permease family protein [Nostocoides jenkinsii]|uniref:ABC3 transporter permease C-terminal domain-containing protein n=1 Tax=Nostocoides jenkinsii Ben 74 TaxID=1193518 RepID=A0A077MEB7_9MICO|nr:FtsX-like permease family protein [Tetrasphaera jenkinsii]CCI55054.1 conserved membrane hypothetical protein [Tetrasphaera jenkinsii Ben 74]
MRAAMRFRWAQALVILLLSALVTAALAFAPLYTRAVDQASVSALVEAAAPQDAGVRISSFSSSEPMLAQRPDALRSLLPPRLAAASGPPIASTSLTVRRLPFGGEPEGRVLWRDGMCEHVTFAAGACPTAKDEIAVSADQARVYNQPIGSKLAIGEFDGAVSQLEASPFTTVRVAGIYQPRDGRYWFGENLTGTAESDAGFDTMLAPAAFFDARVESRQGSGEWLELHHGLDLPLRPDALDADSIAPLAATITAFTTFPMGKERAATHAAEAVHVTSGIPEIAAQVAAGREQVRVIVPLLMAQLALLLGCVLWLVLVAAADQRRGEVALARLRGRGPRGARRLLLAETAPPIILAAPLGLGVALGLAALARRLLLEGRPPTELPLTTVYAAGLALLLMLALAVLSVRRLSTEPIADLLRSIPARRAGISLGVLEAMVVAASGAAFLALATGSVRGPIGQAAPILLAIAVGLLGARLLPAAFAALGRALLRGGRATPAAALLQASRRGTTRWLVPIVTVALCLVVVTADVVAVGARNRLGRAQVEAGAPTVLFVNNADLQKVTKATRELDPTGTALTTVAQVTTANGTTTMGVEPAAYQRIALWPDQDPAAIAWDHLTAPAEPPLTLTGTRLRVHVALSSLEPTRGNVAQLPTSVALALQLIDSTGSTEPVTVADLSADGADRDVTASIPCRNGCRVAGIGLVAPPNASPFHANLTLTDLRVDEAAVELGTTGSWRGPADPDTIAIGQAAGGGLRIELANDGRAQTFLAHASIPGTVPALTTAAATPADTAATIGGALMSGDDVLLTSADRIPFAPGGSAKVALVNLDNLLVTHWQGRGSATIEVYAAATDPADLAKLSTALADRGIEIRSVRHPGEVATAYGRTGAAWSLALSIPVAAIALLVAALGIVVLLAASWRARSRDYAALRMGGVSTRSVLLISLLESVPVVVFGGVLGAAAGLWSAPASLPMIPLFPTPPPTFPVDLRTAWSAALSAGGAALVVVTLVAALSAQWAARRARLDRLRDAV